MKCGSSWQLGYLIPRIVVLALLADGACRLLPMSALAFRGWEALSAPFPVDALFRPNACYRNTRSYGDLAALSNRPWLRQYRDEVFTTDALGYRNGPALCEQGPPEGLLVGSSFSVGAGVPDQETLTAQLQSVTGKRVYNAADVVADVARTRRMVQLLGMRRGLVILECLERHDIPSGPFGPSSRSEPAPRKHWLTVFKQQLEGSRLQILAQRGYKLLEDDCILPNPYAAAAPAKVLRNGATMLFLTADIDNHRRQRPVDHAAAYFSWVAAELRRDNLDLLVLLVPDKYSVYGPLLQEPDVRSEGVDPYLDRLEAVLRQAGIPVVNLLPVFRRQAGDLLDRGEYLYWRDDTHWNATGIGVAARELGRAWNSPCSPPPSPAPAQPLAADSIGATPHELPAE